MLIVPNSILNKYIIRIRINGKMMMMKRGEKQRGNGRYKLHLIPAVLGQQSLQIVSLFCPAAAATA